MPRGADEAGNQIQGPGLGCGTFLYITAGRKERRFSVDMCRFMYSSFSVITPTLHVDCKMKFSQLMNYSTTPTPIQVRLKETLSYVYLLLV